MGTLRMKLYISGKTPKSNRAAASVKKICEEHYAGRYELAVIDILEDPEAAEREQIMATPMLIKESPAPARRIVGDLTNKSKVLAAIVDEGG
jgi:circadian clock protein KaiB